MSNTYRYERNEFDRDVKRALHYADDEIPDAPESWTLDDFEDLLDHRRGEDSQPVLDIWL